ncbi:MAG: hypothetical protein P8K08_25350 [Fuerstiella sp.]|jgi:hypothetical protein|nr:hypothetical protein [Fuerstiella sp.]
MTTSRKTAKNIDGNDHAVPDSPSRRRRNSVRRGKSRTQPDKKSADHATVADGILCRLDEMDARVQQLAAAQNGHGTASTESECLDQLAAQISSSTGALAVQFRDALDQQNQAIVGIASGLSGLQATVSQLFVKSATRAADEQRPTGFSAGSSDYIHSAAKAEDCSPTDETDTSSENAWEQIKNAFLMEADCGFDDGAGGIRDQSALSLPESDVETEDSDETAQVEQSFEIPELTDIDNLADAELRSVLVDRERLMSMLVQRLLSAVHSTQTLSTEQLNELKDDLPAELTERVEQSLRTFTQQERLEQLELSLERARVSRQVATLEKTQEKLAATAHGLGLTISEDGSLEGEIDVVRECGSQGRRWLGVLGFGN